MVNVVASVGRNGVHDFILLRASAIILALYTLLLAGFFVVTPSVTFDVWQSFFACTIVKVATIFALLALLTHARIGVWQVLSDYVKSAFLRAALQFVFSATLLAYLVFGLLIVWGV
ncbi:succinate dehydrogenase, hydrophobic membrane anchor protein [Colwellia sp. D2M02]|uniref:Succinate dehydrogenase hydrophobic membrane anchor subunit n=1 Tax=Colwellia asteriadis TaxID=517723 RepID=A0ABP3WHU7_9GAMM|nr:succinate dehydrogenase, hydrophobic membrane anchor protein [Colwellia sp. D2M02]MBU2892436.1 succinate dehydrogenase, hydrophobic membrane anchor protein [Colwellia sp. D2M02]